VRRCFVVMQTFCRQRSGRSLRTFSLSYHKTLTQSTAYALTAYNFLAHEICSAFAFDRSKGPHCESLPNSLSLRECLATDCGRHFTLHAGTCSGCSLNCSSNCVGRVRRQDDMCRAPINLISLQRSLPSELMDNYR
jgi:hypothetical protein